MKWLKSVLIAFAVSWLSACSDSDVLVVDRSATILALGDSLTVSKGHAGTTYPQYLENFTGLKVIAAGISGEQTPETLKRIAPLLSQHQPSAVIILIGGNDFLRNKPAAQVRSNIARMIETAQSQGVAVLLVAVPQKSLFLSDAALYSELGEQYNIPVVTDTLSDLLSDNQYKSDAIHLNDAGYRALAKSISEHIKVN